MGTPIIDSDDIISKEKIEKRVIDWKKRISELYSVLQVWTVNTDFLFKEGLPIRMYEELMESYDIPPTKVPTADIYKGNKILLSIKPVGLWMIGANGRIDLLCSKGNFILVDLADNFTKPNWKIYSIEDRIHGRDFTKTEFFKIIQ